MRLRHVLLWGMALAASDSLYADDAMLLEELEQRIARLEQGKAQPEPANDWTDKVSINGYITYGITRHDVHQDQGGAPPINFQAGQPFTYRSRVTDEVSHRDLSRVGLQFNAEINDRTSAVVQLLGRGRDNYDTEVQWAFIDYELLEGLNWRGGRLMLPNSMHSQYLNVGYAYHWVELPGEVYDIVPFDTIDGMDLTWKFNTGNISHDLSAVYGSLDVPDFTFGVPIIYEGRDYGGINLRSRWGDLMTWFSYNHARLNADLSPLDAALQAAGFGGVLPFQYASASIDEAVAIGRSVGFQYDNGSFFLMAERADLDIHNWYPNRWGGYMSTGYRFGKWTPHVTWGAANTHDLSASLNDGNPATTALAMSNAVRGKSWTFGLRHDLAAGIDVKFEAKRFYDMSSTKFDSVGANTNGMFTPSTLAGELEDENPVVYRIAVDAVF